MVEACVSSESNMISCVVPPPDSASAVHSDVQAGPCKKQTNKEAGWRGSIGAKVGDNKRVQTRVESMSPHVGIL